MFGGIVQDACEVLSIEDKKGMRSLTISLPGVLSEGLEIGASVAVDGVCLTVTSIANETATFDVILETIQVTTLKNLAAGDQVNIERSLTGGAEVGGHLVSGHVDDVAKVVSVDSPEENNTTIVLQVPERWSQYIFPKGFIALNGVSLTVGFVNRDTHQFAVYLIPETLRRTTFHSKNVGDEINFEVERQTQVIVDTMNVFLEKMERKLLAQVSGASADAALEATRTAARDLGPALVQELTATAETKED